MKIICPVLFLILLLGACSTGSNARMDAVKKAKPQATLQVDIESLEKLVKDTLEDIHWTHVRSKLNPTSMYCLALLPDGREAAIYLDLNVASEAQVRIQAGHFGDDAMEKLFIEKLNENLQALYEKYNT